MRLLRIRLHPFGGTADRTSTLDAGINVLEGPNEFGKSTLSHALWHGLFTPTDLSPGALRKKLGPWYPQPGGDHACITLELESENKRWILRKTWGAGASASLEANGVPRLADATKVQARLITLLKRNEATWRHVLFVSQAELAQTVVELAHKSHEIDDIQALLAGAAAIPGDIPAARLTATLDRRVFEHFSRWDISTNGPEKGKGIGNPWANSVGPVLGAFYAKEITRRDLEIIRQHEEDVDRLNRSIKILEDRLAANRDFVQEGRGRRDDLAKRGTLEEKLQRLAGEEKTLKGIMTEWPGAQRVIEAKETEVTRIKKRLQDLEEELGNARKRENAEQLRLAHAQLTKTKQDWEETARQLRSSAAVDPKLLGELRDLEKQIGNLRIQIAAQKLAVQLSATASKTLKIERGVSEIEEISISSDQAWNGEAEGKICFSLDDLTICVMSGTGDVQGLFTSLESAVRRRAEILLALGHESLPAAESASGAHQEKTKEEKHNKALWQNALQGRTPEDWEAQMLAIAALPLTRSVPTLTAEANLERETQANLRAQIEGEKRKIEQWIREFSDEEKLTEKFVATKTQIQEAASELTTLPTLPAGFGSVADYLAKFRRAEEAFSEGEEQISRLRLEHKGLTAAAPESTVEELSEKFEMKEREFQRQQSIGEALLRIQGRLREIVADRETIDPMAGLTTAVSRHFEQLTGGRYTGVRLDGSAPVEVHGAFPLHPTSLSRGTLGSLALATRLALAELYLQGMEGFIILDDPFTDLDAARRRCAIEAIGTFARKHQVLFLTCHPQHADELEKQAAARRFDLSSAGSA